MAEPASALAALSMGSTLVGGATRAAGSQAAAQAQARQYQYQAGIAQLNSAIEAQNAEYVRMQGDTQAGAYGLKASQRRGAIIAAQSASGFDINSGSNKDVQDSQEYLKNMDMQSIREAAAKSGYDYELKSRMAKEQAGLYSMASGDAIRAGNINAQASILGTVTSVSDRWLQGRQVGLFNTASLGG